MSTQVTATIPATPNTSTGGPQGRRQVLFQLYNWEVVLYKNHRTVQAVHTCRKDRSPGNFVGPVAPRALLDHTKFKCNGVACWNCKTPVPDEIITIVRLFNE